MFFHNLTLIENVTQIWEFYLAKQNLNLDNIVEDNNRRNYFRAYCSASFFWLFLSFFFSGTFFCSILGKHASFCFSVKEKLAKTHLEKYIFLKPTKRLI